MNKSEIKKKLIESVNKDLSSIKESCESACAYKNTDDMKQEGKYDTRSIEAGYLAGAQLKRLEELKLKLKMLEDIELRSFKKNDEIAIGALVELEINQRTQKYFISPTAGGTLLNIDNQAVLVISVFSPIGDAILSLKNGDYFELETPKEIKNYSIRSVS